MAFYSSPILALNLDPGLKFQVSGFEFSESMDDGSMLAHLKSEGRDAHNPLVSNPLRPRETETGKRGQGTISE